MRMWNVDPALLCNQHLLGEHKELHMIVGSVAKNKKLDGYINDGLIELHSVQKRHGELVSEFNNRGWPSGLEHKSPIIFEHDESGFVDSAGNLIELCNRCDNCRKRIEKRRNALKAPDSAYNRS